MAVDLLAELSLDNQRAFLPRSVAEFQGGVIFRGNDEQSGPEAWVNLSGDASGTRLLKDVRVGPGGSGAREFVAFDGQYFFVANNGFNGYELWASSGTSGSTRLLADIWPGSESSAASGLTVFNDHLYFFANDGELGRELFRSDGTAVGTQRVADAVPGKGGIDGSNLTPVGSKLFFVDPLSQSAGAGLWVTDGTEQGTHKISPAGLAAEEIDNLTAVGDRLLFSTNRGLWVSDGTTAGSQKLEPSGPFIGGEISGIQVLGERVFVAAGRGLFELDAGLTTVRKHVDDADGLVAAGGRLYYWNAGGLNVLNHDDTSTQLDRFNSFFGTKMGHVSPQPHGLAYSVHRTLDRHEIWVSNGTAAGTQKLDTVTDAAFDPLMDFAQIGQSIYFVATNGGLHESLWRVDAPVLPPVETPGDVNADGAVNAADIDLLFAARREGNQDTVFDLNGDQAVDEADSTYLVEEILQTRFGDLDLNGGVVFADFLVFSANFGSDDLKGWADGDLNGDQKVDFADFLLLSANFGVNV